MIWQLMTIKAVF